MAAHALPGQPTSGKRRGKGQALVELALVMPLLLGIVAVLFQFGILFVAYLSIVHEMRDIGRFVAVHPDTLDGGCTTFGLWKQVCDDAPSVIAPGNISDVTFNPPCNVATVPQKCPLRTTSSQIEISITYDASSIIFLPAMFRLGPWFNVAVPTSLPTYDYYIMVEPH